MKKHGCAVGSVLLSAGIGVGGTAATAAVVTVVIELADSFNRNNNPFDPERLKKLREETGISVAVVTCVGTIPAIAASAHRHRRATKKKRWFA